MTTAAASSAAPAPTAGRELVSVRRKDIRRRTGYPAATGPLPGSHGQKGDPRYPSPRRLRSVVAFVVDLLLHLATAVVVAGVATNTTPATPGGKVVGALLGAFVLVSAVHRILVQWLGAATFGKLVTGLRLIRDADGRPPRLWDLTKSWLFGVGAILALLAS